MNNGETYNFLAKREYDSWCKITSEYLGILNNNIKLFKDEVGCYFEDYELIIPKKDLIKK